MPISYYNEALRRYEIHEDDGEVRVVGEADYSKAEHRTPPGVIDPADVKRRFEQAMAEVKAAKAAKAGKATEDRKADEKGQEIELELDDDGDVEVEAEADDGYEYDDASDGDEDEIEKDDDDDDQEDEQEAKAEGERDADDSDEPPPPPEPPATTKFVVYEVREVRQLVKVAYIVEAETQERAFVEAMNGKASREVNHGIIEGSMESGESGWASTRHPAYGDTVQRAWKKAQDDQVIARMEAEYADIEDDEDDEP